MNKETLDMQARMAAFDAILFQLIKASPKPLEILGHAATSLTKMYDLNSEALVSMINISDTSKKNSLVANEVLKSLTLSAINEFKQGFANEN
jgi:hypothetical protein